MMKEFATQLASPQLCSLELLTLEQYRIRFSEDAVKL